MYIGGGILGTVLVIALIVFCFASAELNSYLIPGWLSRCIGFTAPQDGTLPVQNRRCPRCPFPG